jgi:RNA polymerase sigma factor (sigma-70 family)
VNPPATSHANVQPRRNVAGLSEPLPALDITPDLVARIHSGDEAALETLINRYVPVLRRICHSRLRGYPQLLLETDDVVQDALISIVRRIPQFVWWNPGALLAYLSRVIRNRIIDAKRKAARQGEWVELPEHCVAQTASPLQRVVDKEGIVRYRAALLRLKHRDRQLIVMRVEQQLPYQEIGTRLRMSSTNAARVAVVRAMARLVAALENV